MPVCVCVFMFTAHPIIRVPCTEHLYTFRHEMSHGGGVKMQSLTSDEVDLGSHLADKMDGETAGRKKRMNYLMRRRLS